MNQAETPSPVFDQLLGVLRGVMAGSLPPQQLKQLVEQIFPRFQEARDATRKSLQDQGADHIQKFADSVGRIEEAFQDVEGALKSCLEYVQSGSEEVGQRSERWLIHAAWNQATAMDAYQAAELNTGPTRMPLVNLLVRMKEGFVAGKHTRAELDDSIRGAIRMAEEAQREIRAKPERNPAEDGMITAYGNLVRMLDELMGAQDEEALDRALQGVVQAGESVRTAMETLSTSILTAGPTRMQHANLVLTVMAAHQAGQVADDVLVKAIEVFKHGMEHESAEVDRMLSLPTQSTAIQDQVARTRTAYDLHWPAIELMESYAAGDAGRYEPATQALIEASEALADCREVFQQIGEIEGKVSCIKCGAANSPDARACSKCGARMLQQSGSSASTLSFQESGGEAQGASELVMTENLHRLFEAVNAVAEEKIADDEFDDVLSWMAELVQEHLLGLPPAPTFSRDGMDEEQIEAVGSLEEELASHREDVAEGAEEFMTALNRLSCFLEDHDKGHLISGVQMVRDGAIRIQKAQRAIDEVAATFERIKRGEEERDEQE